MRYFNIDKRKLVHIYYFKVEKASELGPGFVMEPRLGTRTKETGFSLVPNLTKDTKNKLCSRNQHLQSETESDHACSSETRGKNIPREQIVMGRRGIGK
jgi:hypothetical protein